MQFEISSLKIISPSPATFILDVERSAAPSAESEHVTYIGSAEHCFKDLTLITSKLAHSTIYTGPTHGSITAYAMFDLNDVLIGTDIDWNNTNSEFSYMLAPPVSTVSSKIESPIKGIVNNKNAFIGVIPGSGNKKFVSMTPSRKYVLNDDTDGTYYKYLPDEDAITLYSKQTGSTSTKRTLCVEDEYDVNYSSDNSGGKFDQIFTIQTFNAFSTGGNSLRANQNITAWGTLINNFDNGTLSVASFITPKQTLNSEYSTVKAISGGTTPYKYMRNYMQGDDFNMYVSGDLLVFNYIETKTAANVGVGASATQISTTYSKQIGLPEDPFGKSTQYTIIDDNDNLARAGVYQNYLPELVNVIDSGFGGTGGTPGLPGAKRALHKANIFDIDIQNKYATFIDDATSKIVNVFSNISGVTPTDVTTVNTNLKSKLQKHISDSLQALVAELIPAHTHLFNVIMSTPIEYEPDVAVDTYGFYVYDGQLKIKYETTDLPFDLVFEDLATYENVTMSVDQVDANLEIIVKPYIGTNITKSFLILPGYGKFSGWYRLYVYNEEVKYELITPTEIYHPFTVINGELKVTYDDSNPPAALLFADVTTDDRILMQFSKDDNGTSVEINIEYVGDEDADDNKCITALTLIGTGTNPGEYILYINNKEAIFSYLGQ